MKNRATIAVAAMIILVIASAHTAFATQRTFVLSGTISSSNVAGVSVGAPFVATLSYDDAQAPTSSGSGFAVYGSFTYSLTVSALTFTKQANQFLQVNDGPDQFFAGGTTFPRLSFSLQNSAGTAFSSTALPASLALSDFDLDKRVFWETTPTEAFVGQITSICTQPTLSVDNVSKNEGSSGTTSFDFTVSLNTPACAGGVTFDIATADGTAQDDTPTSEDNDYVQKSLTSQTISAGNPTYSFSVTVNGDLDVESNETFFVNVTNVTGASVGDAQGQGTINNDDTPPPPPTGKAFVFIADEDVIIDRPGASEGDIHANNDIVFKKGKPSAHTGDLTAVDDITIQSRNTIVGVATAGDDIDLVGTAIVTGGTNPNMPVAAETLPSPSFSASGPNHTVPQGGSLTLGPDSYGNVVVGENATLNLSAGDYFFKTLDLKEGADLAVDVSGGEVGINVVTKLVFGKQAEVIISTGEAGSSEVTFTSLQSTQLSIGERARVLGSIIAPKATVLLAKNSRFRGAICADQVKVSPGTVFLHHTSGGSLPKMDAPEFEDIESEETVEMISDYELSANYPNPFNPSTTIRFALPEAGKVTLRIYALTGQLVRELTDANYSSGKHLLIWDAQDEGGMRVASGVYFYRLAVQPESGGAPSVQTKKMTLLK